MGIYSCPDPKVIFLVPTPDALPPLTTRTLLRIAVPSALFTVLTNGYRVVDQ